MTAPMSGILLALLGALQALGAAAIDMYLPAMPTIDRELAANVGRTQDTLGAFLIGLGLGQLFYGPLSDAIGRRRVLMAGLLIYCLAGIGCVFADTIEELIWLRFLQALGAASAVTVRAMVRDMFERDEAARAQSFINMAFAITPFLAPTIGGYVLIWFGWRAIFIVLCVLGALCIIGVLVRIPETLAPENRTPMTPRRLAAGYRRILQERQIVGCILVSGCAFACMFAFFAASPFVYIETFGIADQHYGFLFALNISGLIMVNYLNTRLVIRLGAVTLLRIGCMITAAGGLALLITAPTGIGGLAGVVIPIMVVVASLGFVGANAQATGLAPFPELAGTTASLFGFFQLALGAAMGVVVGLLADGTAAPMGWVIGALGIATLIFCMALVRSQPPDSASDSAPDCAPDNTPDARPDTLRNSRTKD